MALGLTGPGSSVWSKVIVGLGGFIATLASLIAGYRKLGEKEGEGAYSKERYKEAASMVNRLTKPIPNSDNIRNAARDKLRRMRQA